MQFRSKIIFSFCGRNALGIGTAITASVNAELTLSTSYQKVRLANKVSTSSGLSIASYGVKCERAGYVLASAQVYFSGVNDQNVCNARILRNDDMMARSQTRSSGERVELAVSPTLIQVSANDIIYLEACNSSTAKGAVENNNNTHMTVQYV